MFQVMIVVNGRAIGWTVCATREQAAIEIGRANGQGFTAYIEGEARNVLTTIEVSSPRDYLMALSDLGEVWDTSGRAFYATSQSEWALSILWEYDNGCS